MRYSPKRMITVSDAIELDNRWNNRKSGLAIFVAILLAIQPFIVYAVTSSVLALVLLFLFFTPFWYEVLFDYYRRTPTHVRLQEDGIVLRFKGGSQEFVSWMNLKDMSYPPSHPDLPRSRKSVFVGLRVKNKIMPYAITKEIAREMFSRYQNATGQQMSVWDGRSR